MLPTYLACGSAASQSADRTAASQGVWTLV